MALDVKLGKEGAVPAIRMAGRAVDVDVRKMSKRLDELYKRKVPGIVLDVSQTDFIDSHGLGTIVYYHTLLQKESRKLVILNINEDPNAYLNRLFELTHLDKVLLIACSAEQLGGYLPVSG